MEVVVTDIPEIKLLVPKRIGDERGFFSEVWNERLLAEIGIKDHFVQDNHVLNPLKATLRGLHYQRSPCAQGKLVRVTHGSIFDVAIDLRRHAPSFGHVVTYTLSANNWRQLWIPPGFAHGYCTLEDNTEVLYKVTDFYSPQHDRGLSWNDPTLAIDWPFAPEALVISERDRKHPRLNDQPDLFE